MNPPLEPVIVNFNFISSGPCDTGEKKKKEDRVYSCSFRAQSRARVCVYNVPECASKGSFSVSRKVSLL